TTPTGPPRPPGLWPRDARQAPAPRPGAEAAQISPFPAGPRAPGWAPAAQGSSSATPLCRSTGDRHDAPPRRCGWLHSWRPAPDVNGQCSPTGAPNATVTAPQPPSPADRHEIRRQRPLVHHEAEAAIPQLAVAGADRD